ncbi:hypothetical protein PHYSODRAFT_329270 [Phytophthora sojae]|uniref:Uncharacterized protein n=1 Tax=Phytophthora sojae (strain P6497) TaxID=1094619 RepID=G4ZBT0_PHYSP|nr:hypothetical protein PHYSODRAFT_329270 [Phytophthora sojae]EGZ21284.1 hypothetical protein PHYSODRAFT_329270 [Phytophthora sojae]|eukprot:XP_009524001.1 hypothetical protein PHYSODRAFT_329270 [Phytophthora sojae]
MKRTLVLLSTALLWLIDGVSAAGGIDDATPSDICSQTLEELQNLLINQDQADNGVTGNTLVTNDCKELVDAGVMNARSDDAQKSLCGNSCYDTVNAKYKTLLDNDCFASDDADEEASAKLQAASYQIACQTNSDGEYCVPLLATLVDEAGTSFSLCDDIVSKMGCCFQSYRQYMLLGTPASVAAMDDAQKECADSVGGLDSMCPCAYNAHAFANTTFCSQLVFKVSAAGEEIVYIGSTAWVSVQAATRILQHRYAQKKHTQSSVVSGGATPPHTRWRQRDPDQCFPPRGGQPSSSRLMLEEILDFLDNPIKEDTPVECPIQPEPGPLVYRFPDINTKGLYFLQLAPLKKFTDELGHFICGKVGMSDEGGMGHRIQDESHHNDLGYYGSAQCRWYLPFKDSTPRKNFKQVLCRSGLFGP